MEKMEPAEVWKHFYALTQTPRPSGHTEQARAMVVNFAKSLNLKVETDEVGNIHITAPASIGMENRVPVILQAHIDMVPQKTPESNHNFLTDAIKLHSEGDWLCANNTTLGSDDGIGVAAAMAVLSSPMVMHGPLEVLITNDEEIGMIGAFGLKPNVLKGKMLFNMDSEKEGELFIGGAGGQDADFKFKYKVEKAEKDNIFYKISINGLCGGHSGLDIHLERANANKLLFRILKEVVQRCVARVAHIDGGDMRNAIPREATSIVSLAPEDEMLFIHTVDNLIATFKKEYENIEPNLNGGTEKIEKPKEQNVLPEQVQDDIINAIIASPDGVFRHVPGKNDIESSLNLSIVKTNNDCVTVIYLVRSAILSKRQEITSMLESIYSLAGAECDFSSSYPGWTPNYQSKALKLATNVYKNLFEKDMDVKVMHAGLECGIIENNYPTLDIISFGPTLLHPHSPAEKVNISSVKKFWKFLITLLFEVPKQEE